MVEEDKLEVSFIDKKHLAQRLSINLKESKKPRANNKTYEPYMASQIITLGTLSENEGLRIAKKELKELKHKRTFKMPAA